MRAWRPGRRSAAPHAARPRTLLILGGTGFIGPSLTQEALPHGWKVTHFNRGKTAAGGVPGVETLIGDRKGQLDALRGRKWDALIDDTGYIPKYVQDVGTAAGPERGLLPVHLQHLRLRELRRSPTTCTHRPASWRTPTPSRSPTTLTGP